MKALISKLAEPKLLPDSAKASEAALAALNSAAILEAIRVRASTITPEIEKTFQFRPSSHWGINE